MPLDEDVEDKKVANFGSRKQVPIKAETEEGEINEDEIRDKRKKQMADADLSSKKLKLKDLNLDFEKKRPSSDDDEEDESNQDKTAGIKQEAIDNRNFRLDDDDDAFSELHSALDKVRRRVVTNKIDEVSVTA